MLSQSNLFSFCKRLKKKRLTDKLRLNNHCWSMKPSAAFWTQSGLQDCIQAKDSSRRSHRGRDPGSHLFSIRRAEWVLHHCNYDLLSIYVGLLVLSHVWHPGGWCERTDGWMSSRSCWCMWTRVRQTHGEMWLSALFFLFLHPPLVR